MKYIGVLAIGVSIFTQNVNASVLTEKPETQIVEKLRSYADEKKPITIKKISGRILDANKKPLTGIRVVILNTRYYASTDKNGHYEIKFTSGITKENKILAVQSARFSANMTLNYAVEKQVDLLLKMEPMIVGEIMYVPRKGN
ncbi:MAG: carboxypeptidase regulatory-like domain-containing protein [Sphingobacteriales bacterium]|nr:MAG: carboxypeptidase regulatory-like domain-containing protein [Sphingobacteriales bacterium]